MLSKPASRSRADRRPGLLGAGEPVEHAEQRRLEALHAERDAVDARAAQQGRELGRDRLGVRLDRQLAGGGKPGEQPLERRAAR